LETENAKLKRLLADAILDNAALKELLEKMVTPAAGREAVAHLRGKFAMSERRACRVVAVDRSSLRYQRRRPDDDPLCEWLEALVEERRRFGYRRLWVLLRREGHTSTAIGFPAVQERAADGASTRQAQARHWGSLAAAAATKAEPTLDARLCA